MKNHILPVITAALLCVAAIAPSIQAMAAPGAPVAGIAAVFDDYFKIQTALANDSLEQVAANALALAVMVRQDMTGAFRRELAAEAEALARANDLPAARQIFKAVSGYLIQTFRAGHAPEATVHEMHCPRRNVNWLQRGEVVGNPYLGKAGQRVGTVVN